MKIFDAIGRLITSPLCAVLLCAAGAIAIWFSAVRPPRGASKAHLTNRQRTDQRTVKAAHPGVVGRGGLAPTETDELQKSKTPSRIAARTRVEPSKPLVEGKADIEEFEAANEPVASSLDVAATNHRQATGPESAGGSTADTISPRDPRAKSLKAYQLKNAAFPDDLMSQKRMASWCDEQGLWDAAKTHWEAVLRLVPNNDDARKRLGFRWRGGKWTLDAASAGEVAQKKADSFWERALKKLHSAMRCRSQLAVPGRALAVAEVEAVGDPRTAAAIWNVFAADTGHHGMIVGILRRFNTRKASQMLAAMAVYSPDKKAQVAAVAALHGRPAADYAERLVTLMHAPLRLGERMVPLPGRAPARQLLIEGETANYSFLFLQAIAPASQFLGGSFQPRISASQIAMARQFNENQTGMEKRALDPRVELAKQMIANYNDSIRALNERVAGVLNEACGAGIRPDPDDARRWLALTLGSDYQPPSERPKPTFEQIVSPLYTPTFVPATASC